MPALGSAVLTRGPKQRTTNAGALSGMRACGDQTSTSVRDNLKTLALMEAAYDSAASGTAVRPDANTFAFFSS